MPTIGSCGWKSYGPGVVVRVRQTEQGRRAGLAGVKTCGSVWACPCCNGRVMAVRTRDIERLVQAVHAAGFRVVMLTLTMRHHLGQDLGQLWDAKSSAWAHARHGRPWKRDVQRFGIEGWLTSTENTWSDRNGHHVHLHGLLIVRGDLTEREAAQLGESIWSRWADGLVAKGLAAPTTAGLDSHLVSLDGDDALAHYLAKSADSVARSLVLALELTQTITKGPRSPYGTLSMWEVGVAASDGEAAALAAWWEFERQSRGRRQMATSQGLWDRFLPDRDQRSDEEIAAEELGTSADDVAVIEAAGWRWLRSRAQALSSMLDVAEVGGPDALYAWLAGRSVPFRVVAREPASEVA